MKSLMNLIIVVAVIYLGLTQFLPRAFALYYEAHNATVILDGCESKSCHLEGTLTTDPVTLDAVLTSDDGFQHYIAPEHISVIIIPQKQDG